MTNHYNIEILITQTHFKATYRDNKFRRLEHLRGQVTVPMLKSIGRIIPLFESSVKDYIQAYQDKVQYTLISKEKSQFSEFKQAWFRFYEAFAGLPPKFSGADGKSLKDIITYLTKNSAAGESEALATWELILQKWHTLNQFHRNNTDLKYINSKLNIIINAIKQKNGSFTSGTNRSVQL